ncbi:MULTISPECIES: Ku protein [unclassified Streptomyces]|uniref:non-homologous end joining protein Ku n=1 Tax=unclassified Streptomyces TaxID=2593676 RepID=UPI002DDADEBB|nr:MULTISPECIES: Ku protein [unclassified Streptomyces]WSA94947.1 Ku protein [Streptomyces sp. NBC_01795]WSB79367.1 Ku protein [Streptomyces sp. NBC_01775]WSS12427.1 Ku protein [Streptomyces sp. NBC_01186]WSS41140.1 Ku protein [Streptomyces sp. NBC_01187]
MRSIWKGSISFGLVTIPIKVVSATENHSVSFHQVHTSDGGRVRYRKVCELDEEEVPREEIGRGFETGEGTTILLTDDDMAALPLPTAKTVEILGFVPAEEIDPIQLDRSYYLAADGKRADKPYVLLREALTRSGKVAVAKLALRARESLGMLRVYEDALVLHTMLWPDEIRPVSGVAPEGQVSVRDAELDLADTLMETLGELEWSDLHDEYREALEQLVEAKAQGVAPRPEELRKAEGGSGKLVDLMSVLERSVQEAKSGRGEGGEATVHELSEHRAGKTAAKKTSSKRTAKEAPSKKTAAKKSASKKTASKSASKPAAKKTAAKTATKTATPKKSTPKKSAAKKTAAKTSAAKKASRPRKTA